MYTINLQIIFKLHLHLSHTKNVTIKNTSADDISQSFETPQKINHSVTEPHARVLLVSESLQYHDNNTTYRPGQKVHSAVKEYISFQIERGNDRASQCAKSCAWTKLIDLIIDIKSFDQKYVISKGLLHMERLKQHHMVTIGVDQLLSNSAM